MLIVPIILLENSLTSSWRPLGWLLFSLSGWSGHMYILTGHSTGRNKVLKALIMNK